MAEPPPPTRETAEPHPSSGNGNAHAAAAPTSSQRRTVLPEDHLLGTLATPQRERRRPIITLDESGIRRELRMVRVTALLAAVWGLWIVIAAFLTFGDAGLRGRIAESWLPRGLIEALAAPGLTALVFVMMLTAAALFVWGAFRLMRLHRMARWVLLLLAWILLLNLLPRLLTAGGGEAWGLIVGDGLVAVGLLLLLQRRSMAELLLLAALTRRRLMLEAAVAAARNQPTGPSEIHESDQLVRALATTAERYRPPQPEVPAAGESPVAAQPTAGIAGAPAGAGAVPAAAPSEPRTPVERVVEVAPYPLFVQPRLIPAPWGGTGLRWLGETVPDGERIGMSRHVAPEILVRNGPLAGHSLATVTAQWGPWLLGPQAAAAAEAALTLPLEVGFVATARSTPVLAVPPERPEQGREPVMAWLLLHGPSDALIRSGLVRPGVDGVVAHPVKPGDVVVGYVGEPFTIGPNLVCYQARLAGPELVEVKPAEVVPLPATEPAAEMPESLGRPLTVDGVEADALLADGRLRLWRVVLAQPDAAATLVGERLAVLHHVGGRPVRVDWAGGQEWLTFGNGLLLPAAVLYHEVRITAPPSPHAENQPATLVLAAPA